jgi:hypothetical protein
MANSRKENIRLLQLAMQGKLKPEDLVKKKGGINVTLHLAPNHDDPETQECMRLASAGMTIYRDGKKSHYVTLNIG